MTKSKDQKKLEIILIVIISIAVSSTILLMGVGWPGLYYDLNYVFILTTLICLLIWNRGEDRVGYHYPLMLIFLLMVLPIVEIIVTKNQIDETVLGTIRVMKDYCDNYWFSFAGSYSLFIFIFIVPGTLFVLYHKLKGDEQREQIA